MVLFFSLLFYRCRPLIIRKNEPAVVNQSATNNRYATDNQSVTNNRSATNNQSVANDQSVSTSPSGTNSLWFWLFLPTSRVQHHNLYYFQLVSVASSQCRPKVYIYQHQAFAMPELNFKWKKFSILRNLVKNHCKHVMQFFISPTNNPLIIVIFTYLKMRFTAMITSLLAVTLTAKGCQPSTYGCGWNGQDAIVLVCDDQGAWDIAALWCRTELYTSEWCGILCLARA